MIWAKLFNFTSMLTMLHEGISCGHQLLMSVIKARYRAKNSLKLRIKCNIVCILLLYCIEVQCTIFKKYFNKQFRARVDIDTPSDD